MFGKRQICLDPKNPESLMASDIYITPQKTLSNFVVSGNFGVTGLNGPEGVTGTQGPRGLQGPTGVGLGLQGFQGDQGAQGFGGIIGNTGIGIRGSTGSQGTQGGVGFQGPVGAIAQGNVGAQGIQGETGLIGLIGTQGVQGVTGTQGVGTQGDTGTQGLQGVTGVEGFFGLTGAQGSAGTQGLIGGIGSQGGTGSQGYMGNQGTQGLVGYQGEAPQGVIGDSGLTGFQGILGSNGEVGETGVQGIPGATGLNINAGSQGIVGAQGVLGTAGVIGGQGQTGFQSVVGETGIQGETGLQGTKGNTGLQGIQGVQGGTGVQGSTGVQGITGLQGVQGITGVNTVSGDGVSYQLALWSASGLSSSSGLNYDATNLGIGVNRASSFYDSTPTGNLEVTGGMTFSDGSNVKSVIFVPPPTLSSPTNRRNIQDAIDAVATAGGGKVILHSGTYSVDRLNFGSTGDLHSYSIKMKRGVSLIGSSYASTDISAGMVGLPTMQFDIICVERYTSGGPVNVRIQDIRVIGNDSNYVTGIRIGNGEARVNEPVQGYIENVEVTHFNGTNGKGLHVESDFTEFRNCRITYNEIGIDLNFINTGPNRTSVINPEYTNGTSFFHVYFWANSDSCLRIVRGENTTVIGCNMGIPSNAYGIRMDSSQEDCQKGTSISGCYIEKGGRSSTYRDVVGIYVASKNVSLFGNNFDIPPISGEKIAFLDDIVPDVSLGNDGLSWCFGGNVGFGTTDSSSPINIYESGSGAEGLKLQTSLAQNAPFLTWGVDGTSQDDKYSIRYNGIAKIASMGLGDADGFTTQVVMDQITGNLGVATGSPSSPIQVVGLPTYVNNADAIANGLTAGAFYRVGDKICVVH